MISILCIISIQGDADLQQRPQPVRVWWWGEQHHIYSVSWYSGRQVDIVLESIIGRTVEQSMTEVQHEEEILRARSHFISDYSVVTNTVIHVAGKSSKNTWTAWQHWPSSQTLIADDWLIDFYLLPTFILDNTCVLLCHSLYLLICDDKYRNDLPGNNHGIILHRLMDVKLSEWSK